MKSVLQTKSGLCVLFFFLFKPRHFVNILTSTQFITQFFLSTGCQNLDSGVGIYASDPEAYKVFSEILDLVIKDYHKLPEKKNIHHPHSDFGDLEKHKLEDLDPEGKYIISTRVRVGRSQEGYGFPPILSAEVCSFNWLNPWDQYGV